MQAPPYPPAAPGSFPPPPPPPAGSGTPLPPLRPKSGARGIVITAGLLAVVAVGLGFYAFQVWSEQRHTAATLASTRGELSQLQLEKAKANEHLATVARQQEEKDTQIQTANAKVMELSSELAAAQSRLDELAEEREEIGARLAEFRRVTEQFQRMIDSGKLEVAFRRGRMIVQLPAQVLFPSGSADLTEEGRDAIRDVAKILRSLRDRRFIVGGHTDTVPVSNDHFSSNWGLSAARAVNVTEALVKAGLKPQQLVAAGYGEYDPVATNAKEAGRQKNRRIEIILEPKLREIPELQNLQAAAATKGKQPAKQASAKQATAKR